jgi:O-antigen/teichoic acid export membrane protein
LSAARKTGQTLAGHLLVFVQGLVLTPIVIKVSGPEIYGAYILLLSYMGIMFGLSSMGVGISAKRWLPSTENFAERAKKFYPQFWFQTLSVSLLGCVSAIVYINLETAPRWEFAGFSAWIVPVYLVAYTAYSQGTDYFRYTHRVGIFNVATVAQPYLFVSIALGIYWITDVLNAGSLIAAMAVASAMIGGLLLFRIHWEIGFTFKLLDRSNLVKEIHLGFPLVLAYLVDVILAGGDRYIIAAMMSVKDVGMYAPAYVLGSLVMVFPRVAGVVLPPLISQRIDAGDEVGAKHLSDAVTRVFLLVSVPFVLGATVIGKEVLKLYANDEIAKAAWPVIPIVAGASIFYGLALIKSNILFVRLKTSVFFHVNLISALFNIVLNFILIFYFQNIVVAAIATLASYLLSYFLLNQKLKDDAINSSIGIGDLIRIILCAVGMSTSIIIALNISDYQGIKAVGLSTFTGLMTYLALIFIQTRNRIDFHKLWHSLRE